MGTLARLLEWLMSAGNDHQVVVHQAMPGRSCAEATGSTGQIEVVEATVPASRRLCVVGGEVHCRHGAADCCWCEMRAERKN